MATAIEITPEELNPYENGIKIGLEDTVKATQRAAVLYKRIRLAYSIMVALDFAFFTSYLIFFLIMEDKQWFDWLTFAEVLNILAVIILLVSDTKRIYQSFYYILAISFICFVINMIGIFMVRIPDMNAANMNNVRRRHVKEILLAYQSIFAAVDIVLLFLSMYYRFLTDLDAMVLVAFEKISVSSLKYMVNAILLDLDEEGRRAIEEQFNREKVKDQETTARKNVLTSVYQKGQKYIKDANKAFDTLNKAYNQKQVSAPPPPPPVSNYSSFVPQSLPTNTQQTNTILPARSPPLLEPAAPVTQQTTINNPSSQNQYVKNRHSILHELDNIVKPSHDNKNNKYT